MNSRHLYRLLALLGFGGMVSCGRAVLPLKTNEAVSPPEPLATNKTLPVPPTPARIVIKFPETGQLMPVPPDNEQVIELFKKEIILKGSVSGKDQQPIKGIRVRIRDRYDFALLGEAFSDETGEFELPVRLRDSITLTYAMLYYDDVDGEENGAYKSMSDPVTVAALDDGKTRATRPLPPVGQIFVMYGSPYTEYEVKGVVSSNCYPIRGIRLRITPTNTSPYPFMPQPLEQFSGADGSYFIPFNRNYDFTLQVEDVDGKLNGGEFESQQVEFSFEGAETDSGGYRYRQTVNIELKKK